MKDTIFSRHGYRRHSPEARLCGAAIDGVHDDLPHVIGDCASGRELRAMGFAEDVEHMPRC